jgi:DNA-binding SARP family transcriptional activator
MIRLTLFGPRNLVGTNDEPVQAILQQPKQFAVLAYLALAGPGFVRSRDSALALFWPDSTETRARHGLNQAIHCLRQALGPDAVLSPILFS